MKKKPHSEIAETLCGMSAYKSRETRHNNICKTREHKFSLMKEGEVMKGMTSAEVLRAVTEESTIREIYIMALEAEKAGKSLKDFVKELEARLNK